MVTCPWCSTTYEKFQPNCDNCGGLLPRPETASAPVSPAAAPALPSSPPLAPRQTPPNYAWRLLQSDGASIVGLVFIILGGVFFPIGCILTIVTVTAFVGIPFLILGAIFLAVSSVLLARRYQYARQIENVLRNGSAVLGEIVDIQHNYSVRINGRHPWEITYHFRAGGQDHEGKLSILRTPPPAWQQIPAPVYVVYDPETPKISSLYPPP